MGQIIAKKSSAYYLAIPAISVASPEQFSTGETMVDTAYAKIGAGAWTSIALADSFTEIATTGMYEIDLAASELAYDQVLIKVTGATMADDAVLFDLSVKLVDDLNDFDPAVDTVARVTLVDKVETVSNIVNVTTITTTSEQICDVFNSTQPYRPGVSGILANVRDSLSDPDAERFTELRLVRLLDKAQKDLNIRAQILRAKVVFQLVPTQSVYTLPVDTRVITRVLNEAGPVPLMTHEEADAEYGLTWESETGNSLKALIYDKQNQKGFKTYPILDNPTGDDTLYDYVPDSDFGLISVIGGFTSISDYGVSVVDDSATFSSPYGVVGTFTEIPDVLRVTMYTLVNPETLTAAQDGNLVWTYSPLQVPDTYDTVLEHYVTGIALRDDQDTLSRELSREHLASYGDLVQKAIKDAARNNIQSVGSGRTNPPKYNSVI